MSSRKATRRDFEHLMAAMKKGEVKPATHLTHRVPFEQVKEGFEGWLNRANGVINPTVEMD